VDPTTADIAVRVYDLDEIAARLAATADYNGLTTLLAADLAPERIIASNGPGRRRRWRRGGVTETPPTPEPTPAAPPAPTRSAADTPDECRQEPEPEPDRNPEPTPNDDDQRQPPENHDAGPPQAVPPPDEPAAADPADRSEDRRDVAAEDIDEEIGDDQDAASGDGDSEVPRGTAEAVAYWLRREPNLDPELLAERIGRSLRSVYRYLPPDYPRRPGIARERRRRQPGPARRAGRSG
jgi:hypothetical protein